MTENGLATFIGGIWNLRITATLSQGVTIPGTDLKVFTDPRAIGNFLSFPKTKEIIGSAEFDELLSGRPVVIRQSKVNSSDELKNGVRDFIKDVSTLYLLLWLYRDNAVNGEMVFGIHALTGITIVHSNFHALSNSKADCTEEVLELRRTEFLEALSGAGVLFKVEGDFIKRPNTQLKKNTTRLMRFQYHLEIARKENDIALKIAAYCNAFEALLSTSTAELAHTLAERLSLAIAKGSEERVDIYRTGKRLYSVRSSVSHGSTVQSANLEQLVALSTSADNIARRLFKIVLESRDLFVLFEDGENSEIEDHFLKLIMA